MPTTYTRKAGYAILLSFWSAVLVILSDAAYGGYLLKLQQYEQAALAYQWLALHTGYSLTNLGFFTLYLSLPLALAGCFHSLPVLCYGGWLYKPIGLISMLLAGASLWYAAPSLLMTGYGLALLVISPHTHSLWDRIFAICMLLIPFSAVLLCRLAAPKPSLSVKPTNDL